MNLRAAKRRHLVSAYATVRHLLLQMEEAARDGRSPTGVGAPLTPLPAHETEPALAPVRELAARLREAALRFAPSELAALEQPQSANNTLVWLSNLLERTRFVIDDLHPRRMRKYGPVAEEEEAVLRALHEQLAQHVAAARSGLEECEARRGITHC